MKELEKIENKLEKIDERIDNIDKHLAVYNSQLRFHIKRTDMLEEEMKPLKSSMVKAQGAMMFIGLLATITSIGIAAWGVLGGR
jgi:chromosome segregation ATPase|tara:strand:- start:472 stop:723 length:252 start_codon:yes stop_codon:yes gene_type:complete